MANVSVKTISRARCVISLRYAISSFGWFQDCDLDAAGDRAEDETG